MRAIELKREMDTQFAGMTAHFAEVDARFADVDTRFAQVDARFAQVDARFAQVDARFAQVDARFADVDARFLEVKAEIAREAETTRRHFDVIAGQLRSDMSLLASALATVSTTLDRSIAENRSEHATFMQALDNHEVRITAIERSPR